MDYIDVEYLGQPRLIACGVLEAGGGLFLVDPGASVNMEGLEAGLEERGASWKDVRAVVLTHIHLDHAGATGSIIERNPDARVVVHRIGAPHLARPERLMRSAGRIYGDEMDRLWGEMKPVPEENIEVIEEDGAVTIDGKTLRVAHTPGHAIHHVSYLDEATGTAMVGDVAGMCVEGCGYVLPVTPPPDVDLERWHASLNLIREWRPEQMLTTHFGVHTNVNAHLDAMAGRLEEMGLRVREDVGGDDPDEELASTFGEEVMDAAFAELDESCHAPYRAFGQPEFSWHGFARYWRKKEKVD